MANTAGVQASIGNGQTMNADAAIYWRLLVAAVAAACGVWVTATEGTRTYARQKYLYDNRNRPGFNPAWSPDSPYAYHLSGRAVDVGSGVGFVLTRASAAFYRLAGRYGFRATVKGEPWHFEWRLEWVDAAIRASVGSTPSSTTTPASSGAVVLTPEMEAIVAAKDTVTLYTAPGRGYFLAGALRLDIGNSNGTNLDGQVQVDTLTKVLGIPVVTLKNAIEYDRARVLWFTAK